MREKKTEKTKINYLPFIIAFLIGILGIASFAFYLIRSLKEIPTSVHRFKVPGKTELYAKEEGRYTVFIEYRSFYKGKEYNTYSIPPYKIEVVNRDTGEQIKVLPPSGSITYDVGKYSARGICGFNIKKTGPYIITVKWEDNSEKPEAIFTIGHSIVAKLVSTILVGIFIMFASFLIPALIIIVYLLRYAKLRKKEKEKEKEKEEEEKEKKDEEGDMYKVNL